MFLGKEIKAISMFHNCQCQLIRLQTTEYCIESKHDSEHCARVSGMHSELINIDKDEIMEYSSQTVDLRQYERIPRLT